MQHFPSQESQPKLVMEFGGFDDDLFTETEKKPKKAATVDYKPKTLLPQWYTKDQAIPKDDPDKVHFYIFRGNRHYYQGAWSDASDAYTRAMDSVAPNNTSMRRLLLESLARCRWRLGDACGAVEMGKKLVEESTNDHQLFGAHSALAIFYDAAGNAEDQANSLTLCLDIRPLSVQHWIQLAKLHLKTLPLKDCKNISKCHAVENDLEAKRHIGQYSDNRSPVSGSSHCASQWTSNDYSANVESCPSAAKDSTAHYGNTYKDECILNKSQDGIDKSCLPHSGNVNGDACENRQLNHSSSSMSSPLSLASSSASSSVSVRLEDSPTATGNVLRRSSASSVPNIGAHELQKADKLERLSLSGEGTTVAKDLQPNRLEKNIGGGGDVEEEAVLESVKCLLKAQVILKSLQICAVSLTKMRNAQLLTEIDELMSSLHLDPAFVQDMSKKMYNEMVPIGAAVAFTIKLAICYTCSSCHTST